LESVATRRTWPGCVSQTAARKPRRQASASAAHVVAEKKASCAPMKVAPDDRGDWAPIVFRDDYAYKSCFCLPGMYCCPTPLTMWHGTCCVPGCCCFVLPDPTMAYASRWTMSNHMFDGAGTGETGDAMMVSYNFWHTDGGYSAVEIFRNARAVNFYGEQITRTGCFPSFPSCTILSLMCRTKKISAVTYGDEAEVKKVTNDRGRCATVLKKGELKPLPGSGDAAALAEAFGQFHYGWKDDKRGTKQETMYSLFLPVFASAPYISKL